MTPTYTHPRPFLTVRVDRLDPPPPLSAACVGYELGRWRCRELARHVLQWLPEFALRYSEWTGLDHADAVTKVAEAARSVYESERYERRGEFGEVLLHVLLRQHMGTVPAISKIYFKDSRNDTVKGFDAVHVLEQEEEGLELWLGEVKFYADLSAAIRDVVTELSAHTEADYLRSEFLAITNKLDDAWEGGREIREMLARERSLDQIFSAICLPVLLTYDSEAVGNYDEVCQEYEEAFRAEVTAAWEAFVDRLPDLPVRVHLFLLPLREKRDLVREMDEGLRHAQELV